jgi:hypothetical protein
MKAILTILLIFLIASTFPYTPSAKGESPTPDNTLVVCIGAHTDDIDIAISGTLYKNDLGKHPILWLVVTDGAADIDEYQYETNSSRNWLTEDGKFVTAWKSPDGSNVIRPFHSVNMGKKRCGGYFEGLNWTDEPASHNSIFGVEYDWRTRASNFLSATIEKIQLSYLDPNDTTKRLMYPDGALANAEIAYTNSIATNIANEITNLVEANGYQKTLIKIYSHAPEEVANNANEHSDHKVTGNAVRQTIDLLHENHGFGQIDAKWFTIYNSIDPKSGYVRADEDISLQETQKTALAKACWETEAVHSRAINYTWIEYPEDPGQYEHTVAQSYYATSPSPLQNFIDGLVSLFNNIVHQYPLAIIVIVIIVIVAIAVAVSKSKSK